MESLLRLTGVLLFWHISEGGGFGRILVPSAGQFFLHRKLIISGDPVPGSAVTFTPLPPLEGKIYPRASAAVITKKAGA